MSTPSTRGAVLLRRLALKPMSPIWAARTRRSSLRSASHRVLPGSPTRGPFRAHSSAGSWSPRSRSGRTRSPCRPRPRARRRRGSASSARGGSANRSSSRSWRTPVMIRFWSVASRTSPVFLREAPGLLELLPAHPPHRDVEPNVVGTDRDPSLHFWGWTPTWSPR